MSIAVPERGGWCAWALALTFVAYLFSCQAAYVIVNPAIEPQVYLWTFAIFLFPGGALLDRFGARQVLPASIALVTTGILVFAFVGTYESLLLSHLILAIGSGTGLVGACYVGGQWFGKAKFGVMCGVAVFVAALASAMAQNLMPVLLQYAGWRSVFLGMSGFGLALLALAMRWITDPAPIGDVTEEGISDFIGTLVRGIVKVAMMSHVWIASLQGAALVGTLLSFGMSASMPWLALAIGSLIIAMGSNAIGSRKVPILAGTAIQLGSLIALLYLPWGAALRTILGILLGFSTAVCVVSFSTVDDVVSSDHMATSVATVGGGCLAGGLLIAQPGLQTDSPLLIALAVALALAVVMKETYPRPAAA